MPSIRISVDSKALTSQIRKITNKILLFGLSDDVKKAAAGEYAARVDKYVPQGPSYKGHTGGSLRNSVRIVPDGKGYAVRYSSHSPDGYDYAGVQYAPEKYGKSDAFWNRHTADTYSHWNRHLTRAERQEFYQAVGKLVKEGIKRGR